MALQVYVVAVETREETDPQSLDESGIRSALETEFASRGLGHRHEVEQVRQVRPRNARRFIGWCAERLVPIRTNQ